MYLDGIKNTLRLKAPAGQVKVARLWPLKKDSEYDIPCSYQIKTSAAINSNNVFQCNTISSGSKHRVAGTTSNKSKHKAW